LPEHRILLIDDDLADRLLARRVIRQAARQLGDPFRLLEAGSGPEALEAITAFAPTLILLDMRMPVLDGAAVLRQLRERSDLGEPIIVILSNASAPSDRRRAREAGCDGYLVKPLREADVVKWLQPAVPTGLGADSDELAMHRALLQMLPGIAVLIFDGDCRYRLAVGPALSKHGWSEEMLLGRTVEEVFPPAVVARLKPFYDDALAGRSHRYSFTDTSGNQYEVVTRPLAVSGESLGMLLIQDVTEAEARSAERDTAQAALLAAQAELTQWVQLGEHDVRAVLRQVSALGAMQASEPDELREFQDALHASVARVDRRVDLMIAFHQASDPLLHWQPIDVVRLLSQLQADRAAAVSATGATITAGAIPICAFDVDVLGRVLSVLLDNALANKSATRPLSIHLSAKLQDDGAVLRLCDTGRGLPAQRARLFEPSWSDGSSGSVGLGLALCRRLLDSAGGWIRATDTPGGGATFEVFLPNRASDN